MKIITLESKEQLDIYMNPQRQRLLRSMEISGTSCTPKELSITLGISPSSIQHHLKKLALLGLVYVDHTEVIHGIVAKYYALSKVIVHIGMDQDDTLKNERKILIESTINTVLTETLTTMSHHNTPEKKADILTGIVHLSPQKVSELQNIIQNFITHYNTPDIDTTPFEYALMYHHIDGGQND